ncbi:MAG: DMT family transporter [Lachnospiraceae bacterium]|nr:DMT family transporter [Lachnospiraceae bacterium]
MTETGKKHKINAYPLALFGAAFFWGTTFVAQNLGAGHVGTFTFLTLRSFIGTLILLPVILLFRVLSKKEGKGRPGFLLVAGAACGVCLFLGSALQQYGIVLYVRDADSCGTAKASFITALYVVLVPLLSVFLKKRPGKRIWIAVVCCVIGLYLLCISETLRFTRGDLYMFFCALVFSVQIMCVDYFSPLVPGLSLSALEFFVCGLLSLPGMLFFEKPVLPDIRAAMPAILYTAVFSNGIAYTLQIVGQKRVQPTLASLIMCLESVFGVAAGWIILHESLSLRQLAGCGLILSALIIVSIPGKKRGVIIRR